MPASRAELAARRGDLVKRAIVVEPPDWHWWASPWQWDLSVSQSTEVHGHIGALTPLAPDEPPPPPPRRIGFRKDDP